MRRARQIWTIAIALWLTLPLPLVATAADPRVNITATPRGHQLAAESAARFAAKGMPTQASDLAVLELPDGGVIVVPSRLANSVTASSHVVDGVQRFTATVAVGDTLSNPGPADARRGTFQAAAAPYPLVRESGCFNTMFVRTAHFDVCYEITQVMNDADSSKDYWGLEQWGTAVESASGLRSAFVSGQQRSGSNTQSWLKWSPPSSITRSCTNYFVGFTSLITIGGNFEVCEKWTITKSANVTNPYFKSEWGCNSLFCSISHDDRAVAYTIMTTLGQGKLPLYTLGYGMDHA